MRSITLPGRVEIFGDDIPMAGHGRTETTKRFPAEAFDLLLPRRIHLHAVVEIDPEKPDYLLAITVWTDDVRVPEGARAPYVDVGLLPFFDVDDGGLGHFRSIPCLLSSSTVLGKPREHPWKLTRFWYTLPMRTAFLFAPPAFGPRLGSPIPIRKLGQGCIEPVEGGSGGCRDVVPCPKGPATGNNPDGAAGPGQGRRYTLVDYKDGSLIKEDVGDEIWSQYSVTSLPDAWVCEDPRCKPYCGQQEPEPAPEPQPAPPPAQAPAPAPAPEPPPVSEPEGPVPLTIDIQAFTPGGMGPIPAQPLMQPTPIMQPKPAQPVVKAAPAPAPPPPPAPKEPESKPLETGSAIGIGLVALTAIAAAVFGGGK